MAVCLCTSTGWLAGSIRRIRAHQHSFCGVVVLHRLAAVVHYILFIFSTLVSVHARAAMCDGWYPLRPTIFVLSLSVSLSLRFFFLRRYLSFFHKIHYFYIVSSRSAVRVCFFIFIFFVHFQFSCLCVSTYLLVLAGVTLLMWFCFTIFFPLTLLLLVLLLWLVFGFSWMRLYRIYQVWFRVRTQSRVDNIYTTTRTSQSVIELSCRQTI